MRCREIFEERNTTRQDEMTGRNAIKAVQRHILLPLIAIVCTAATGNNGNVLQQNRPWKMDHATNARDLSATFDQGKSEVQAQLSESRRRTAFASR